VKHISDVFSEGIMPFKIYI